MRLAFEGVVVPKFNEPLIQLETHDGITLDFYNEGWLRSTSLAQGDLIFLFKMADGAVATIKFLSIRNLKVTQPEDWAPQESDQIEHFLIRPDGHSPRIDFYAGGLSYEFDAATIAVGLQR